MNPELPVFGGQTLDAIVSDSLSQRRFSMQMIGLFAVTALLLAGLGIYGVISYIVSEHTREIGIRMALGAQSGNILSDVLRQGMQLAAAGAGIGLAAAFVMARLMSGLLFGVRPTDPWEKRGQPDLPNSERTRRNRADQAVPDSHCDKVCNLLPLEPGSAWPRHSS